MTSTTGSRDYHYGATLSEDELVEIQSADSETEATPRSSSDAQQKQKQQQEQPQQQQPPPPPPERKQTSPASPAYVAPIPRIGAIPPVSPGIDIGIGISPSSRPQLPDFVGAFLVGKRVDEYGDIVDDETGRVFARAGGDLPSIVGRTVSNRQGDILGDGGELLGYVEDLGFDKTASEGGSDAGGGSGSAQPPPWLARFPTARSLMDIMRQSTLPLIVDHKGNILDTDGNVVGKFRDNNNPMHRKEREEEQREGAGGAPGPGPEPEPAEETSTPREERAKPSPSATPQPEPEGEQSEQPRSEKRQNAQSWRKENESPSDIFLDVKSTTEGIQLTIRIPTVFNGSPVQPKVQFS